MAFSEQISSSSKKKIFSALLLLILLISIPVGIYLARQAQTGRSRASEGTQDRDRSRVKQVGAYLFYWYNRPNNPGAETLPYVPSGFEKGEYPPYSASNLDWYKNQIKDMEYAGVNTIFPVSMGQVPDNTYIYLQNRTTGVKDPFGLPAYHYGPHKSLFDSNNGLIKALDDLNSPMKVGLFDDITSVGLEWNDLADNRQIDGSNYCAASDWNNPITDNAPCRPNISAGAITIYTLPANQRMDEVVNLHYDRKIKDFFTNLPRNRWATHNNQPVDQGGRPIIIFYPPNGGWDMGQIRDLNQRREAYDRYFGKIKDKFKNDFGVEPFIMGHELDPNRPGTVADAAWGWGGAVAPNKGTAEKNGNKYTVAVIGPGQNGEKLNQNFTHFMGKYTLYYANSPRNKDLCVDRAKHNYDVEQCRNSGGANCLAPDSTTNSYAQSFCDQLPESSSSKHLEDSFNKVVGGEPVDLLLIETWNELLEGTGIMRAKDYPVHDAPANSRLREGKIDPTTYLTALRNLLGFAPTNPPELITSSSAPAPTLVPVVTPTPTSSNSRPVGRVDGVNNDSCTVFGFVKDIDTPDQDVQIHVYKDVNDDGRGGSWVGAYTASRKQSNGSYAFNVSLSLNDNQDHKISVWGLDTAGENNNSLLLGSPQTIRCPISGGGIDSGERSTGSIIQNIISLFGGAGNPSQGDQNKDGKINELDFGAVYSK